MKKRINKKQPATPTAADDEFRRNAQDDWCSTENLHDRAIYEQIRELTEAEKLAREDKVRGYIEGHVFAASQIQSDRSKDLPPGPAPIPPAICAFLDFRRKLAATAKVQTEYPLPSSQREYLYVKDGLVNLECPLELIPKGLGRLQLKESDGTITDLLPELTFNRTKGCWWFKHSIDKLLNRKLKGVTVQAELIRAADDNRADFDTQEVRAFVRNLKDGTKQKQLAVAYLKGSRK